MPDFQRRHRAPQRAPIPRRRPRRDQDAGTQGNSAAVEDIEQQAGDGATQDGATQDGAAQAGADHGELAAAERTRVVTAATGALPAAVTGSSNADLRTRITQAVQAAAVAAFDACVAEVLSDNGHAGQPASADEVTAARTAYDGGPGVAVGKFGQYLDEIRGSAAATDAHLEQALERYAARTGRSVSVYTGIASNEGIELLDYQVSGRSDGADAAENIEDIVAGEPIERSAYGNAPGGTTEANDTVLDAIASLGDTYDFRITAFAGGSHSRGSAHYDSDAFDVDRINGVAVSASNTHVAGFMQACRDLGATLVLGPGSSGHDTHVHAEW